MACNKSIMTWFIEDKRTLSQKLFGNILKTGPLPKHVAIIMDGNRRYAKNKNIEKIEGHVSGFEKLVEALNWCFTMDIKEVTVYAFSIENFKRSPEEVNALFDLALEKFQKLLSEKEKIDKLGVCIKAFGDISLLPANLQQVIAKVMDTTKHNNKLFMNVCIAYTSRDEMTMAVKDICNAVQNRTIEITDINEDLIENCLYTNNSHEVDLLVRTSGEVRLSDFLLWQSNLSVLSFVDQLWPEFTIWNFYLGILNYQLGFNSIKKMRHSVEQLNKVEQENECKLNIIKETKNISLEDINNEKNVNLEDINKYVNKQTERTQNFLSELHSKRLKSIEILATGY